MWYAIYKILYIDNPFKPEFPLNRTFCLGPEVVWFRGVYCVHVFAIKVSYLYLFVNPHNKSFHLHFLTIIIYKIFKRNHVLNHMKTTNVTSVCIEVALILQTLITTVVFSNLQVTVTLTTASVRGSMPVGMILIGQKDQGLQIRGIQDQRRTIPKAMLKVWNNDYNNPKPKLK